MLTDYLFGHAITPVRGLGQDIARGAQYVTQPYRVLRFPGTDRPGVRPAAEDTRLGAQLFPPTALGPARLDGQNGELTLMRFLDFGSPAMLRARYEAAALIGPFRQPLLDASA